MLTRLKVSGFKNLVNVDVRFGPFTCIAGANGIGKSNLFDAITFLHLLADLPLIDAALSVRGDGGRATDVRGLFHRAGDEFTSEMSFVVEMIVPREAGDDLGQEALPSITFLQYTLILAFRSDTDMLGTSSGLELVREELVHISRGEAGKRLLFPHKSAWRDTALKGRRTSPFISTETENGKSVIKLHQEGKQGRARSLLAANLPRTVLSATNAAEGPTVVVARQEMRSWRNLQLEPSALRRPDAFTAPTALGTDGSHLPATLYRLAHAANGGTQEEALEQEARVYAGIANRLSRLIDDVRDVRIDRDAIRELLTLFVSDRDKTDHPARALSDGTLRFLALAILELDPEAQGLLCLEEPENGIHPRRVPAILQLLEDISVDVDEPIGSDNPLRQVIVNTHSPAVVSQVPDSSLLVAMPAFRIDRERRYRGVQFGALPGTWRTRADPPPLDVPRGELLAYLDPVPPTVQKAVELDGEEAPRSQVRVIDRSDMQPYVPGLVRPV